MMALIIYLTTYLIPSTFVIATQYISVSGYADKKRMWLSNTGIQDTQDSQCNCNYALPKWFQPVDALIVRTTSMSSTVMIYRCFMMLLLMLACQPINISHIESIRILQYPVGQSLLDLVGEKSYVPG
jgi:hypothetical protein